MTSMGWRFFLFSRRLLTCDYCLPLPCRFALCVLFAMTVLLLCSRLAIGGPARLNRPLVGLEEEVNYKIIIEKVFIS